MWQATIKYTWGLRVKFQIFLPDFNQIWMVSFFFIEVPSIKFHGNSYNWSRADTLWQTDGRKDMTKLVGAICDYGNASKRGHYITGNRLIIKSLLFPPLPPWLDSRMRFRPPYCWGFKIALNTRHSERPQNYALDCADTRIGINPLNAELNPIRHLLALVGAHHIFNVSRISFKSLYQIWRF